MTNAVQKVEPAETTALISVIERAASNPNVDIEKMERLLAMQERILAKNAEQAFSEAMNRVQDKIRPIAADASNPQTRSKYASYAALDRALRPVYTAHGFSLSFDTGDGAPESYVRVVCNVRHSAGHKETYHADMPADGKGAKGGDVMTKTHATGSAMSYGMRYLLKMIFNVAVGDDDDDGQAASGDGPISETELDEIRDGLDAVGANVPKFCEYMGVDALAHIRKSQLGKARAAIAAKRRAGK